MTTALAKERVDQVLRARGWPFLKDGRVPVGSLTRSELVTQLGLAVQCLEEFADFHPANAEWLSEEEIRKGPKT